MASISGSASNSSYEPYALGIPSSAAAFCACSRLRDAMASIDERWPCCMPGITFFKPIAAVLRTPQRIFLDMVANHNCTGPGNGISGVQKRPTRNDRGTREANHNRTLERQPACDTCCHRGLSFPRCKLTARDRYENSALSLCRRDDGAH